MMRADLSTRKDHIMTNATNNPAVIDTFKAAIIADGSAVKAHAAFYKTCEGLHALHVMADDIKKGGRYYETAFDLMVELRLTAPERKVLNEAGAMKVGTPKHKIANKVGGWMRNIRDNLRKIEGAGRGKPQGEPKGFADLCGAELRASYNRAVKDRTAEEPAMIDHAAFISHLTAAADAIGVNLKETK
jgi:hypothetical protein